MSASNSRELNFICRLKPFEPQLGKSSFKPLEFEGFRMMRSYIFVSTTTALRRFNSIEFDGIKNGTKELFALVAIADKPGGMIKQLPRPGEQP